MSKKSIFVIVSCVCIVGFALAGYGQNKPSKKTLDTIRSDATDVKFTIPKTKAACEEKGGVWKKIGIAPVASCNIPTTDAGKQCESSKVCEGACIVPVPSSGLRTKPFRATGTCSSWAITVGCWGFVANGWASVMCID